MTKKKLKPEIYHLIRNDIDLREKIAKEIGIAESSVYTYAKRQSPTLQKPVVLKIIQNHTLIKKEELIEV